MICFRPIFCNLQHVALIPIENYDDTHKPRRGGGGEGGELVFLYDEAYKPQAGLFFL